MRDGSVCIHPLCPLEDSPKICGVCIFPGKLIQIPKSDTEPRGGERGAVRPCWQHIDLGYPGPAPISLGTSSALPSSARGHKCQQRRGSGIGEKPKGTWESAVGLMELGQGVVLCKGVALVSLLPQRRGCSWGIRWGRGLCLPYPSALSLSCSLGCCSKGVGQE